MEIGKHLSIVSLHIRNRSGTCFEREASVLFLLNKQSVEELIKKGCVYINKGVI